MSTATAEDRVWIENTQPRVLHLPDDVKESKGEFGASTAVALCNGPMLRPSAPLSKDGPVQLNPVTAKYWERRKSHPIVRDWMKLGYIKLHSSDSPGAVASEVETLADYNEHTAIALLGGEDDLVKLKAWAEVEAREQVKLSLANRIDVLVKARAAAGPRK